MRIVAALLLASCGPVYLPDPSCIPPASFVTCDVNEDGAKRCWEADTTDWLVYADGTYIHENRVSQGAEGPIIVTELCRGKVIVP